MRPIVALLTDFGSRDHYAGAVKGAVLAACSEAQIVDITHEVKPQDIFEGAFALAASYRAFPAGAVFMVVVDPGVGTARRGLAVEAGGYRFVGPDNGLLTLVLQDHAGAALREITNPALCRREVSKTFHARDIFGPVAGHLAGGAPFDLVGPEARDPLMLPFPRARRELSGEWTAQVVHQDRFGNLTTSLNLADFQQILTQVNGDLRSIVGIAAGIVVPVVQTYSDVLEGEACALLGSSDRLEIGVNRGNAAALLGLGMGAPVRIRPARVVL